MCKSYLEGGLANFSMVTSSLETNALLKDVSKESVCTNRMIGLVKMPILTDYFGCKAVCGQMRSKIAVFRSSICKSSNSRNLCDNMTRETFFIGFDDLAIEGHFLDQLGNEFNISNTEMKWRNSNPNGFEDENCLAVVSKDSTQVIDVACGFMVNPICNVTEDPVYSVLGNTDVFGINSMERFLINPPPGLSLQGFNGSEIMQENGKWVLKSQGLILAKASYLIKYPFGRNNWQLNGNQRINGDLNIHACNDDEYPCSDGTCIGKWFRCDEVQHCVDGSDENDCNLFSLSSGYNEAMPPFKFEKAFDINMYISIGHILKLDLQENTLEVKFYLQLKWRDSRVKFSNLLKNGKLKFLRLQDTKTLWSPKIIFRNHRNPDENEITGNAIMSASLINNQHLNHDHTILNRNFVFDGKDVILTLDKEYAPELLCNYELSSFPFDQQICFIEIGFINTDNTRYNLSTDLQVYKYSVYSIQLGNHTTMDTKYLKIFQIPIVLVANVRPVLINTYMPTTLLTLITQMTNYLELPEMFEMSTTVNTTVLLTLSALFVAVFNR